MVITAGYVPLDIVLYGRSRWHAAGGTAGNVAAILSFLGWDSSVITDVGDDLAGSRLVRDLRKSNVGTSHVRCRSEIDTPRVVHSIDANGHRFTFQCPECGQSLPRSRPLQKGRVKSLLTGLDVPPFFFFDRLNAATLTLAEHFARRGSIVFLEPRRLPRTDLVERALAVAKVVKWADDETLDLSCLEPRSGQLQVATHGDEGASFRLGTRGSWHHSPAFPFPVVDAGGAGDWTTAGLIHALSGHNRFRVRVIADALRWAQALAVISCGAPGARGLARQQSREAVVRAVKFVEQRGEAPSADALAQNWSRTSVPSGLCRSCLMPSPGKGSGKHKPLLSSQQQKKKRARG